MRLLNWWVNSAKPSTLPVLVGFPYHDFPYKLVGANDMQFFFSIWFFALGPKVTKCPQMTFSCDFQLDITRKPEVRLKNHRLRWPPRMQLPLGGPLPPVFKDQFFHCALIA